MRANFGGSTCNSSVVPSSWDDSETTEHSIISATSESEDELIKEFKKDLELSKNDYSDSNTSHSSKISVIEQSGTYSSLIFIPIFWSLFQKLNSEFRFVFFKIFHAMY